jgi:hypothetical protein
MEWAPEAFPHRLAVEGGEVTISVQVEPKNGDGRRIGRPPCPQFTP